MRYVEVNGVRVSAIGLGTWQFGSREWGYGKDFVENEAGPIVNKALDLGINLIDTAEIYGFGASEKAVGRAIRERRDEAFGATKVFPIMPLAPIVDQRARASARRMGIDTIDLYQVHWPNPVVPFGTTMDGMRRAQESGVVRHVGVSNFNRSQWQSAEESLGSPVLSNQVQYSLAVRKPDRQLVPHAQENDRLVIAYSPLAQGLLSARYDAANPPTGAARAGNALFLPENLPRAGELLDALRDIAKAHDASPVQVALAWVIRRPNVVAIPGASKISQVESNAAAADLELTEEDDARLTEASDRFSPQGGPAAWAALVAARFRR